MARQKMLFRGSRPPDIEERRCRESGTVFGSSVQNKR